jgi:kinetochor protein Mis14/NSL1
LVALRSVLIPFPSQYINRTFSLAAPNLSINGLPVGPDAIQDIDSDANTAYEPFDARKRQRVADLIAQEEKLLEEVASLKRAVPARAASEHAALLREGLRRDEELLEARVASSSPADAARLDGVGPLERQAGVEDEFRRAVEALGRLKKDMPAVVAKMERARVAGEYVVTDGR